MLQRIRLCTLLSLLLCCNTTAAWGALRGGIIENRGQVAAAVRYYAYCGEAVVSFTATAVVVDLPHSSGAIRLRFIDSRPTANLLPREELPGRLHFFTGSDPARWRSNLRLHSELVYREVWPGIDVVFQLEGAGLQYRVEAAAGSDPARARFDFDGAERITTSADGTVVLAMPVHDMVDRPASTDGATRILSWGTGTATSTDSTDDGGVSGTLSWSTLLGGLDNDYPHGLAVDALDRPVVTGYTRSTNFPVMPGAYDSTHSGSYDVFVAKLDASGSSLRWATFLGGYGEDRPFALALSPGGDILIAGHTYSPDFPTTNGGFDRSLDGVRDAFVARLDSTGAVLLWSTYLGGVGLERSWSLVVGADDRAVVAGETSSADFPTTAGAHDRTLGGSFDAFVTQLDTGGNSVLWSTFLGGSANDWVQAMVFDTLQRPLVAGTTCSTDFPVTPAAFDRTYHGGCDAFVAQLSTGGDSLVTSTYLGGSGSDIAHAVGSRPGRIVVAGSTVSSDFPVTSQAFDVSYNGGGDAFIAELDDSGTTLDWSTFLGGGDVDEIFAMVLDHAGRPIVSGETSSADFPTTWDGIDRVYGGNQDAFVTRLDPAGETLDWSTFLGGGQWDSGWDFALDTSGNPLLTGPTRSTDFPTTVGAYDRSYNGGGEDVFLVRLAIAPVTDASPAGTARGHLKVVPNPSDTALRIEFTLARTADVHLQVFDVAGHRVAQQALGFRSAGRHEVVWSGLDARGTRLPPGVYWLRVETGGQNVSAKVVRMPR